MKKGFKVMAKLGCQLLVAHLRVALSSKYPGSSILINSHLPHSPNTYRLPPNSEKQIFSQMATHKQGARVRDVPFFDTKTHFRPLTSAQPNNIILNHMANPGRTV